MGFSRGRPGCVWVPERFSFPKCEAELVRQPPWNLCQGDSAWVQPGRKITPALEGHGMPGSPAGAEGAP